MNFSTGEIFFWGGVAGMVAVLIITAVFIIFFLRSRKRLDRKMSEEYGGGKE